MPVSLNNQVALVIGASSGIGRATAVQFAGEGVSVMACARRKSRLQELEGELNAQHRKIAIAEADAAKAADMHRVAKETHERFGKVDILVYATGTNTPDRSLRRLRTEIWDTLIQVNLNGAYYATEAVLPLMREARSGYLIYVSSISGLAPDVSGAAYQASKRGLVGFSHAIRMEERENGIRTSVVCPGLVNTEILEKRPVKPTEDTLAKALVADDVAELIVGIVKLHPRVDIPEVQIVPTYL
jgi:NADP-dependent 3-hydroxy acid dehydrogenase YdfG